MKKLAPAFALTMSATPVVAADLICSLRMKNGQQMTYAFDRDGLGDFVELAVSRNGSRLEHAPQRRPVWEAQRVDSGGLLLTYVPDRSWAIGIVPDVKPLNGTGMLGAPSISLRSGTLMGEGICGFPGTKGRRTSPIPDQF